MMGVAREKLPSHWWWFKSNTHYRSPWLQSTLAELDDKAVTMLRIIEEDADTFAQKAEMYFKKRPQLINMIGEIYRAHLSLAEGYDQIKRTSRPHTLASWKSPLPFTKDSEEKMISFMEKSYDSYSESFDVETESESSDLSEIKDPDDNNDEEEIKIQAEKEKVEVPSGISLKTDEVVNLREEIERLQEESRVQEELLMQKDEEKREAIRQLCIAMDLLREENSRLRMNVHKATSKKENSIELKASKKGFWKRLFTRSPKSDAAIVIKCN